MSRADSTIVRRRSGSANTSPVAVRSAKHKRVRPVFSGKTRGTCHSQPTTSRQPPGHPFWFAPLGRGGYAEQPDVEVPHQFVQNGQIVLNIAPAAVSGLQMTNDVVTCSARFGGAPHALYVPMWAVKAIYARENGAGTVFEAEPGYTEMQSSTESEDAATEEVTTPSLKSVDSEQVATPEDDDDKPTPPSGGRPNLRVIK